MTSMRSMSLIRQIWLLLGCTLLAAFVGSAALNTIGARSALETQVRLKNSDNANALAAVLAQQKGDPVSMEALLAAQFDTGYYRRLRLQSVDGTTLFARDAAVAQRDAPAWFAALLPIESVPGHAQVSDGWHAIGSLEVVSHTAYAEDELWTAAVRSAAALFALAVVVTWLAAAVMTRLRAPLERTVLQAQKLVDGEFQIVDEPDVPELRRVTQAMNAMVGRLKLNFEAQAQQLEALRLQATCDPLTGLANRKHFLGQLAAMLQREDGPARSGLVLVRVLDLAGANRQLGHEAADRMIGALAQALRTYEERIRGCHVGRLNGADFALCLPVAGVAFETGVALAEALRVVLPSFGPGLGVAVGAVELERNTAPQTVMMAADSALARAESHGPFRVELGSCAGDGINFAGEGAWRAMVAGALGDGRARLMTYPLLGPTLQLLHLECPLRLQLDRAGPFEPAARWLPLALRAGLTSAADERAVALALAGIDRDGLPRCVNLGTASLKDGGFAPRLRTALQDHPQAARKLSLELPERAAVDHFDAVQGLGRQLRPTGIRFGIEHAGEQLGRIDRLFEAGLDYAKLDASIGVGLAGDAQRTAFVKGIVAMLHGLAMQVFAEGVVAETDALALWSCGVDGLTGPWASSQRSDLLN